MNMMHIKLQSSYWTIFQIRSRVIDIIKIGVRQTIGIAVESEMLEGQTINVSKTINVNLTKNKD